MDSAWDTSRSFSETVFAAIQTDTAFLDETRAAYVTWGMDPGLARARTEAVVTLAAHAALTDRLAAGARTLDPPTAQELVDALLTRPEHEFFAAVPKDLDRSDLELLADLKALAYSEDGPTKRHWLRLAYQAREVLRRYSMPGTSS